MRLIHLLIPAFALLSSHQAIAQANYPDRPIKMIVPLAAASAVDVAARIVTQKMADNMGQQIVILNQPGASGPRPSPAPNRTATRLAGSTTAS
jgi:tripartite-type tricarboxylate transporter receptor subunit TctC